MVLVVLRRAFWLAVAVFVGSVHSEAQDQDELPAPTVSELSIEVRSPDLVDAESLRDSLHDDLGARVEIRLVSGDEEHARAHLTVEWNEDLSLVVLHLRRGEEERRREIVVDGGVEERSIVLALLASNLVRDEADELIASLRAQRQNADEPPRAEPLDVVVEETPETVAPEADVAPVETPRNRAVDSYIGLDLAPYVGMSSYFLGQDTRMFSLGMVGALSGRIRGLGISGAAGVTRNLAGIQIAGALALTLRDAAGIQAGGVASVVLDDFDGIQFAGATTITLGRMRGVQVSGALNIAGAQAVGGQVAIANYAAELRGLQFGNLNLAGSMTGVQAGVVNYANEVHGVQLGLLNVASGDVHGMQIGLVNLAKSADASIGLINIYRDSRTQFRFGMDTAGFMDASLVHGSRITHSIYSVSANPVAGRTSFAVGLGVGARVSFSERVHLDIDVLARALFYPQNGGVRSDAILEPRLVLGVRVYKAVGFFVGLAYPIRFSGAAEPTTYGALTRVLRDTEASGSYVDAWPSLSVGLEIF
ncbi:MAG: hypothetical protein AB8H86_16705 [Polyangiales bacterium]